MVVAAAIIIAFIISDGLLIILAGCRRKDTRMHSSVGRRSVGGTSSHIPLKVNTAGVILAASSLFSTPIVIGSVLQKQRLNTGVRYWTYMNSSMWFRPE